MQKTPWVNLAWVSRGVPVLGTSPLVSSTPDVVPIDLTPSPLHLSINHTPLGANQDAWTNFWYQVKISITCILEVQHWRVLKSEAAEMHRLELYQILVVNDKKDPLVRLQCKRAFWLVLAVRSLLWPVFHLAFTVSFHWPLVWIDWYFGARWGYELHLAFWPLVLPTPVLYNINPTGYGETGPGRTLGPFTQQGRRYLSLIHIWRCRRSTLCRSRWSPYH